MEFGLWFEPEMVNLDSDLVRAHPDWVLGPRRAPALVAPPARPRPRQPRGGRPRRAQIRSLVAELGIDFIKWDHNRDLHEAVRSDAPAPSTPGRARADRGALRPPRPAPRRHPGLEIESCSSGGAPGRPRGPRPHRPDLDQRLQRRPRARADPALDLAAGAARADRRPRRPGDGAHHRTARSTCRSGCCSPCRATPGSSGTSPPAPRTSSRRCAPGRRSTASCAAAAHRRPRARRPARRAGPAPTGRSRRTVCRRLHAPADATPVRRRRRAASRSPGSTRSGTYRVRVRAEAGLPAVDPGSARRAGGTPPSAKGSGQRRRAGSTSACPAGARPPPKASSCTCT